MQSEIFSILIWTFAFGIIIARTDKELGVLEGKLYKFHIFFAWVLLMLHYPVFKMLGWTSANLNAITKYFYVPVGPIPAWLNLTSWALNIIFSILAVIIAYMLAKRKEQGRVWLLRVIPILYISGSIEGLKGYYKTESEVFTSLAVSIPFTLAILAIPFGALYYFYSKASVRERIFSKC